MGEGVHGTLSIDPEPCLARNTTPGVGHSKRDGAQD